MSTPSYNDLFEQLVEQLDLFSLAITRAHGKTHPEVFDVRKTFESMYKKTTAALPRTPVLDTDWAYMRHVTCNYVVPDDVCETYEAVYQMLFRLDTAYQNE